jgi:hypothetical protein
LTAAWKVGSGENYRFAVDFADELCVDSCLH